MSISADLKDDELTIGKLIQKKRKEKDFTQAELAEELNVSSQAVSKWEREICDPDKQHWNKLSKLLDIPAEQFAGLYESPEEKGEIPPGVIAALKTFSAALDVVKSDMIGGSKNDRDSDDRADS